MITIIVDEFIGGSYLHNSLRPSIIDKDANRMNILLDRNFVAKLRNFELLKTFNTGIFGHISAIVTNSPRYVDPKHF